MTVDGAVFWPKVDRSRSPDDCWTWRGTYSGNGYGQYAGVYAHRIAYALANGPIPHGLLICHRCDVKSCVNPAHLYAGTVADNNRDARERGRWQKPPNAWASGKRIRRTHCRLGHPLEGDNLYVDYRGGRVCITCHNTRNRERRRRQRLEAGIKPRNFRNRPPRPVIEGEQMAWTA